MTSDDVHWVRLYTLVQYGVTTHERKLHPSKITKKTTTTKQTNKKTTLDFICS